MDEQRRIQGRISRVHLGKGNESEIACKSPKKQLYYRPTDQPTNQRTDSSEVLVLMVTPLFYLSIDQEKDSLAKRQVELLDQIKKYESGREEREMEMIELRSRAEKNDAG